MTIERLAGALIVAAVIVLLLIISDKARADECAGFPWEETWVCTIKGSDNVLLAYGNGVYGLGCLVMHRHAEASAFDRLALSRQWYVWDAGKGLVIYPGGTGLYGNWKLGKPGKLLDVEQRFSCKLR